MTGQTRRGGGAQLAFSFVLTYYWAIQFTVGTGEQVTRGSALYYLYVLPVAVFSALLLPQALASSRHSRPAAMTAAYAACVCTVALVRGDTGTLLTTALFSATLIVVFALELAPRAGLLNRLFLLSIVVQALLRARGATIYGVLPGMSDDGQLWWRVAVIPQIAASAYFALIVLFVNVLDRRAPGRMLVVPLAAYFLVFAGIRSAVVGAVLAAGYLILLRRGSLRRPRTRMLYIWCALGVFVTSLYMTQLLLLLPTSSNATVNQYIFRSEEGFQSETDAAKSIYRTWLWTQHLQIAARSPLVGIGTFDFNVVSEVDPVFGDSSTGSEAFLTGLLARVGVSALLLLAAFASAIREGARVNDHLTPLIGVFLFIAMLAYGSFINAYDFVFLVMVGLLAGTAARARRARHAATRQTPVASAVGADLA